MKRIQRLLWASYLFVWAWSIPLLALDLVPAGGEFMASVMLVLPGSLCAWWLVEHFKAAGGLIVAAIWLGSWAVEHLGVTTGWPFGSYRYTGVLAPALPGGVPLAIPFAWLLVVPGAMELARWLLRQPAKAPALRLILLGATLATTLDMIIEPVAVYVNAYWNWQSSGPFYGIPTSNFIAWWIIAGGFGLLLRRLPGSVRWLQLQPLRWSLPATIYAMNLGLFTIVDLSHGYLGAGMLGLAVLGLGGAVCFRREMAL